MKNNKRYNKFVENSNALIVVYGNRVIRSPYVRTDLKKKVLLFFRFGLKAAK